MSPSFLYTSVSSVPPLGTAAFSACMVQQAISSFSKAEKHSGGLARLVYWASCPLSFHPNT